MDHAKVPPRIIRQAWTALGDILPEALRTRDAGRLRHAGIPSWANRELFKVDGDALAAETEIAGIGLGPAFAKKLIKAFGPKDTAAGLRTYVYRMTAAEALAARTTAAASAASSCSASLRARTAAALCAD
jgi:hypothetical protein